MIRGTTPTHTFNLPIDTGTLRCVRITYEQLGRLVLMKTEADVTMEGNAIKFKLTQEESLKFREGCAVKFQIDVLTKTGDRLASPIRTLSVEEILHEEVLV